MKASRIPIALAVAMFLPAALIAQASAA